MQIWKLQGIVLPLGIQTFACLLVISYFLTRLAFVWNSPRRDESVKRYLQEGVNPTSGSQKSYGELGTERDQFCEFAPKQPYLLDETIAYEPGAFDGNYESKGGEQALSQIQDWRGENEIVNVARSCADSEEGGDAAAACNEETSNYLSSLLMYTTPILGGLFSFLIWHTCCWVSCCRCCRRCCLCAERKGPRDARAWQRRLVILIKLICFFAILASAGIAYSQSAEVNGGLKNLLCLVLHMAHETLNGSPQNPIFLGIDPGIQSVAVLRRLLDIDGRVMTDLRLILDETANFANAMDDALKKISHMKRTLMINGQQKIKEHACTFCEIAVGNNRTGEVGLLTSLQIEIEQSSAAAMQGIRDTATRTLTGKSLVDMSTAVKRSEGALDVFRKGYVGAVVESIISQKAFIDQLEESRHTGFQFLAALSILHVIFASTGALWYARQSKAKYPAGTPSLMVWCCGFCTASFGLVFAGLMLVLAIPNAELCQFLRYELVTHNGFSDYYREVGLVDIDDIYGRMDPMAVDVARTCFTSNGTGDILEALHLRERLDFQRQLDDKFVELSKRLGSKVVDVAGFELLVSQAELYGGLFVLAPDDPRPLEPNAAPQMMGSSVDPDDQPAPKGGTMIAGLNTYAGLIAGAGKFSFAHGTAGGGILITDTQPGAEDTAGLSLQAQNALHYARLKEQILTEPDVFRCDILDSRSRVVEKVCGFEEYRETVVQWAQQVRQAGTILGQEAQLAIPAISQDLRSAMLSTLREVNILRTQFGCRFLRIRWEELDTSLCGQIVIGVFQGAAAWLVLAFFTAVLIVLHYKVWRHFLDNKIVGVELEKFSKKYGYLQTAK
eukprot:gnl/MRDRNA2_/MRDRNA2_62641_c0_seq1.p1 gnl/MRDRNA2_/MRDRNA2_62641_c0~~gnl/MRDRNA2_/MRDRNA2_62641_c0_seq1.p1  ORF type:complete len:841 (-),score=126.53 gnl/MRDRNA2_/MRDRNA2_62641_c0_seq1:5-2527(-)